MLGILSVSTAWDGMQVRGGVWEGGTAGAPPPPHVCLYVSLLLGMFFGGPRKLS